MSQMMIQRQRREPLQTSGRVIAFECAICRREPRDGVAVTATDMGVLLCDQHIVAK